MARSIKTSNLPASNAPLTSEARDAMLDNMLANVVPHYGELFIPDDSFYANIKGIKLAEHMAVLLCRWLGIKPGYIKVLLVSSHIGSEADECNIIRINQKTLANEFLLASEIACGLTAYLIEKRNQLRISDQSSMLAAASIKLGLGLIVANGMQPASEFIGRLKYHRSKLPSRKSNPVAVQPEYYVMLKGYLRKQGINPALYNRCLTPWAAKKLGIRSKQGQIHAVREARHALTVDTAKFYGIIWLILVSCGIGGYMTYSRISARPKASAATHERVNVLAQLSRECKDSLAYERQYADLSDIQTVRNLNAFSLRCQSLENQHKAARQQLLNES